MRHPESTQHMQGVRAGSVLPDVDGPAVILKAGKLHPDADGTYAWRVVVHTVPGNTLHPFAVSDLHYDDETASGRPWVFGFGSAYATPEAALDAFKARTV
jgi:hypothetical protein